MVPKAISHFIHRTQQKKRTIRKIKKNHNNKKKEKKTFEIDFCTQDVIFVFIIELFLGLFFWGGYI